MVNSSGKTYAAFNVFACDIQKFLSFIGVFNRENEGGEVDVQIRADVMFDFEKGYFDCSVEFNSERDFLIFQNTLCIFCPGVRYIS